MSEKKNEVVRDWFTKANHDIKNIENNLAATDIPADTVCFHAQQAIEKYFKGALIHFEKEITKTHDLVKLLREVALFIPELSEFEEELEKVTEYAVGFRYPDAPSDEPSLEEAKQAYQFALKVRDIIVRKVRV